MAPTTPTFKLNSGHTIPILGLGIWQVPPSATADLVYTAIRLGYRHIDGAHDYTNSRAAGEGIARAIKEGLVKREDLFVTAKLWNNYHRAEHAIAAAKRDLAAWGLEYFDLYLVHFPLALEYIAPEEIEFPCFWRDAERKVLAKRDWGVSMAETWGALEGLVFDEGKNPGGILRSIGVANFGAQFLGDLWSYAKVKPAVLQIEHHPYLVQKRLLGLASELGVVVTGYCSLGPQSFLALGGNKSTEGVESLLTHASVVRIAEKHGVSPAQVLLRWATQRGVVVIPKSVKEERLVQNLESLEVVLGEEELRELEGLDRGLRFNDPSNFDPGFGIFD